MSMHAQVTPISDKIHPGAASGLPQPALIAQLEMLLGEAQSGVLQSIAAVTLHQTGRVGHGFSGTNSDDLMHMLGGVTLLQLTLAAELAQAGR